MDMVIRENLSKPRIRSMIKKKCHCSISCGQELSFLTKSILSVPSCPHSPLALDPPTILYPSPVYETMYSYHEIQINDDTLVDDNEKTISNDNSYCSEIANIEMDNQQEVMPTNENLFEYQGEVYEMIENKEKTNDDDEETIDYLQKFNNVLKKWRDYEDAHLKHKDVIRNSGNFKYNVDNNYAKVYKAGGEITPYETNFKLTYEDLTSDENREQFGKLLNDWYAKEEIILNGRNRYFTSTPEKKDSKESVLDISKISQYESYDFRGRCPKSDKSLDVIQDSNEMDLGQDIQVTEDFDTNEELNTVNLQIKEENVEIPQSINSKDNKDLNCNISLSSDDLMLDSNYKSDSEQYDVILSMSKQEPAVENIYSASPVIGENRDKEKATRNEDTEETLGGEGSLSSVESNRREKHRQRYVQNEANTNKTNNRYKPSNTNNRQNKVETSVATYDLSSLVSNNISYYTDDEYKRRSMQCLTPLNNHQQSTESLKQEILKDEIRKQAEVMDQISKAVIVCRKVKKWSKTRERIEAEKIFLLATIKNEALLAAINSNENTTSSNYSGSMFINNIKFTLREKLLPKYSYYYICIIRSGTQVKATKIIQPIGNAITFTDEITMEGLSPDCEVQLSLYTLILKGREHESNYKTKLTKTLQKVITSIGCINHINEETHFRPISDFKFIGEAYLCKYAKKENKHLCLLNRASESIVDNTFSASIELIVQFDNEVGGYINMGKETNNKTVWTRRWCRLKGMEIKYYNFPTEEATTEPIGTIKLQYLKGEVTCPKYALLFRNKTLKFEVQHPDQAVCQYYLTPDSFTDFKDWQRAISSVVDKFRSWKIVSID